MERRLPKVLVDGVFFQLADTGIARLWRSVLEEWVHSGFARQVVLLDRAGTSPHIPGISTLAIPRYDHEKSGRDSKVLQYVCDCEQADLFVSSYYTTPISTPSVLMLYDMIPEVIGANLSEGMWCQKRNAILHASGFLAISHNTLKDLRHYYPQTSNLPAHVAHCGIGSEFTPAPAQAVSALRANHKITRLYFLLVGERTGVDGYKNASLFFNALSELPDASRYEVLCAGGTSTLEEHLRALAKDTRVTVARLTDAELRAAYSGAVALVYPSLYEGFGLPMAEAMACGCPVIACRTSSIPEVVGEAALFVGEQDTAGLAAALTRIQDENVRRDLIARSLERARDFTWARSAARMADALKDISNEVCRSSHLRPVSLWEAFRTRESEQQKARAITALSLAATETALAATTACLHESERNRQHALDTIAAMQSSKFWALRTAWIRVKNRIKRILKSPKLWMLRRVLSGVRNRIKRVIRKMAS